MAATRNSIGRRWLPRMDFDGTAPRITAATVANPPTISTIRRALLPDAASEGRQSAGHVGPNHRRCQAELNRAATVALMPCTSATRPNPLGPMSFAANFAEAMPASTVISDELPRMASALRGARRRNLRRHFTSLLAILGSWTTYTTSALRPAGLASPADPDNFIPIQLHSLQRSIPSPLDAVTLVGVVVLLPVAVLVGDAMFTGVDVANVFAYVAVIATSLLVAAIIASRPAAFDLRSLRTVGWHLRHGVRADDARGHPKRVR